MNDIISLIGTIASIGSIPLGFYFFIKGKEEKRDKVKRDIVKILLYQLNDSNLVSIFEIQSVINSKCRESKVHVDTITMTEIIDDLLSEIISNPLLQKESKTTFIANLKYLSHRILTSTDSNFKTENVTIQNIQNIDQDKLETELQNAQRKIKEKDKSENFSELFRLVTTLLAGLLGVGVAASDILFNKNLWEDIIKNNAFVTTLIGGLVTAVLGLLISLFVKRAREKSKD